MFFRYSGSDPALSLKVVNLIIKDANFLNQKVLGRIGKSFVENPASTLQYFLVGNIHLPKTLTKVRVDCDILQVYIIGHGWLSASDQLAVGR